MTATNAVIDVIDAKTMQRKLGEADPVLRARDSGNSTNRLADANEMNEQQWLQLNIYQSLTPDEIVEKPWNRGGLTTRAQAAAGDGDAIAPASSQRLATMSLGRQFRRGASSFHEDARASPG